MSLTKLQQKLKQKEKERKKEAGKGSATSKEALDKIAKDSVAHICSLCRQAFPVNATVSILEQHVTSKHSGEAAEKLFPEIVDMRAAPQVKSKKDAKSGGAHSAADGKARQRAEAKKAAAGGDLPPELAALLNAGKKKKSGSKAKK